MCGYIEVQVLEDGAITIQKKPIYYFPSNLEDDLYRRMAELRPVWGKYCLYTDEELDKEYEKFSIPTHESTDHDAGI